VYHPFLLSVQSSRFASRAGFLGKIGKLKPDAAICGYWFLNRLPASDQAFPVPMMFLILGVHTETEMPAAVDAALSAGFP
jgi:hypothetical protein